MKHKFIVTSAISAAVLTYSLLATSTCVVFADDNEIIGSGKCGEKVQWTMYSDGTLELSGTGATYDYTLNCSFVYNPDEHYELNSEYGFPTWYDNENREDITTIIVDEGITRLGDLIFFNISHGLEQVNLPDSLEEIGYFAVSPMGYLGDTTHSINKIPENLKVIESGGLCGIDFEDKIILPESVEKIGSFAFNTPAKEYAIPQNIKEISPLAFGITNNDDYVDNNHVISNDTGDYLDGYLKFVEMAIFRKNFEAVQDMFKSDSDVTVYGYRNTISETYADENSFNFIALDEEPFTAITTTTAIETQATSTSAEITSQNTTTTSGSTTTTVSTTSKNTSAKENSPKTGDKGIIGIGAVLFSAWGMFSVSKKKHR